MKKYVDISGFNINQANRGNAALSYGAIAFLKEKELLNDSQELVWFYTFNNLFKKKHHLISRSDVEVNSQKLVLNMVPIHNIEKFLLINLGIILPFTLFGKIIKQVEYEAADYGGDGFSDIYGEKLFKGRMRQTFLLMKARIPLIMLPMTIGPFRKSKNKKLAEKIMHYASCIYVRDDNYVSELKRLNISFERTKDLSAFMKPEKWAITIPDGAIGLNVSGLAYSNTFPNLEGQFACYPKLISAIIHFFREKGNIVYLIPHSYNYATPEPNNDDMVACRTVYEHLEDKTGVCFLDQDLSSPQVKYVISKMSFFIGTRMHANFAAIYTGVPVFGLAYSYKFAGAFEANGLDGDMQTYMINHMKEEDIEKVTRKISEVYKRYFSI